jgi:signal transduction histidine kinase
VRARLRAFGPTRITAQLASVVIVSVIVIQIGVSVLFHFLRPDFRPPEAQAHIGTLVRLVLDRPPGAERRAMVEEIARTFPSAGIRLVDRPPEGGRPMGFDPDDRDRMIDDLRRLAPIGLLTFPAADLVSASGEAEDMLALGLGASEWLLLTATRRPSPPLIGPVAASVVFALFLTALLGLWAVGALVRPLRALAEAARDFDIEHDPKPLVDAGPDEVRVAIEAFDAMRNRIRVLVDDRTRMLAAMGHDLRTPITRLRLRTEFIGNADLRREVLHDLELMTGMIEGALTYLREGRHDEPPERVDLVALVETLADQWTDLGHSVAFTGPEHLVVRVRGQSLTRALTNLVDNAVKYGTRVSLRLAETADGVAIEVEDDGPGIPEAEREAMQRPFVRGDAARNLDADTGFGLGLAIARAVAEVHGGRLTLASAEPHGTIARIDLPLRAEPAH